MISWLIGTLAALGFGLAIVRPCIIMATRWWRGRRQRRRDVSRETRPLTQLVEDKPRDPELEEWLSYVHPDAQWQYTARTPGLADRFVGAHGYGATLYFGRNLARRQASGHDPSGLPGHQLYRRPR